MKKLSKLTALLLALMLLLAAPLTALAEAIDTESEYEQQVSDILAALYDTLMASTTYEEVREATKTMTRTEIVNFLDRLLADQVVVDAFDEYDEYLWQLYEEYIDRRTFVIPVTYNNVAPLRDFGSSTEQATLSLQSRDTTADSGIVLTKTASALDANGEGTITLEAFSTGAYTQTTTSTAIDVILVLDLSKSMYSNNDAGIDDKVYDYQEIAEGTTLDQDETYYVKYNGSYVPVIYCDEPENCNAWTYGCYHVPNDHAYLRDGVHFDPTKTQFYTLTISDGTNNNLKKLNVLRDAVIDFVDSFANMSTSVNNRIAIVTFNSSATIQTGSKTAATAFVDMQDNATTVQTLVSTAAGSGIWDDNQGTRTDLGVNAALNILTSDQANTTDEYDFDNRKRVVVVFTDGTPSNAGGQGSGGQNLNATSIATNAISYAEQIKNDYTSTVYTIGVVDGANVVIPFTTTSDGSFNINQFLQYLSSNFQNATSYTNEGTPTYPQYGSYYLTASNSDALKGIFSLIAGQIETDLEQSSQLGATSSTTVDILSDYFTLPAGVSADDLSKIKVYTAACTGGSYSTDTDGNVTVDKTSLEWATKNEYADATISLTGDDTISVSNFSFLNEWCGPEIRDNVLQAWNGSKLIIEIPYKVKSGFLGGNGVPTNTAAGVYDASGNLVQGVESPTVDVPVKTPTVEVNDINVYLTDTLTQQELLKYSSITIYDCYGDDVVFDLNAEKNYGLEDWQTAYVNLDVTLPEAITTPLVTDTTYGMSCSITSKTDSSNAASDSGTAKINVYKPVLTFQDSEVSFNEVLTDPTYFNGTNYVSTVWKYGDTLDTAVTMHGTPPTLTLDYVYANTNLAATETTGSTVKVVATTHIPVGVTVAIGGTDVTSHCSFLHEACTFTDCPLGSTTTTDGSPAFYLHLGFTTMTITKTGMAKGESAIFAVQVTTSKGEQTIMVSIPNGGTVTIGNLVVGSGYTVTESGSWTWKYTPTPAPATGTIDGDPANNHVEIDNTGSDKWLNDEAYVHNDFSKDSE